MNPTHTAVSPSALSRVLDAMDGRDTVTLRALSEQTGLGATTVSRAVQKATRLGILSIDEGTDPVSGRPCHTVAPAASVILPILTLNQGCGTVRATDPRLTPLGCAVSELNPAMAPEENLRLLCRRGMALLRGCAHGTGWGVSAPVLVTDTESAIQSGLSEAIAAVMGVPPMVSLTYGEAIARGLSAMDLPRKASTLLFLRTGEGAFACILCRDGAFRWQESPLGRSLSAVLSRYPASAGGAEGAIRWGAVSFVTDLCRFLSPDLLVWEDPRHDGPSEEALRPLLPGGISIAVHKTPAHGLSLAEYGAALTGRRILWDKLLENDRS